MRKPRRKYGSACVCGHSYPSHDKDDGYCYALGALGALDGCECLAFTLPPAPTPRGLCPHGFARNHGAKYAAHCVACQVARGAKRYKFLACSHGVQYVVGKAYPKRCSPCRKLYLAGWKAGYQKAVTK